MRNITDNRVLQLHEYFKQNNIKQATQNEIISLYRYIKNDYKNEILDFIHNELNKNLLKVENSNESNADLFHIPTNTLYEITNVVSINNRKRNKKFFCYRLQKQIYEDYKKQFNEESCYQIKNIVLKKNSFKNIGISAISKDIVNIFKEISDFSRRTANKNSVYSRYLQSLLKKGSIHINSSLFSNDSIKKIIKKIIFVPKKEKIDILLNKLSFYKNKYIYWINRNFERNKYKNMSAFKKTRQIKQGNFTEKNLIEEIVERFDDKINKKVNDGRIKNILNVLSYNWYLLININSFEYDNLIEFKLTDNKDYYLFFKNILLNEFKNKLINKKCVFDKIIIQFICQKPIEITKAEILNYISSLHIIGA